MRKIAVGLLAMLFAAFGWWGAAATAGGDKCDKNGNNAAGCDFDGDGIDNKTDTDDDNDGADDESDPCPRDAADACDDGSGGGGEDPTLPVDPEAIIAEVQKAVEDALSQLPAPPGDLPAPPGDLPAPPGDLPTPPSEPPVDPAEVQAAVEQAIADITGQLPAPPSVP